ncbi:phosphoribosyltransferase [Candidatus Gottesmanbacteria bacterium]|nr:phosphoribosyltransferase [Candidatus Gottesmanbacteria bacterium]
MFKNRLDAGYQLAEKLIYHKDKKDVLVLGLARGGVVVAKAIANKLKLFLSVICVKKLGAPGNPELAIGAVSEEKTVVWNKQLIKTLRVDEDYKEKVLSIKYQEVSKQQEKFRQGKELKLKNKTVILVDDGIATGLTMAAAIKFCRQTAAKIILAAAVCAKDSFLELRPLVDEFICLEVKENFYAVGEFYEEFGQVSDEEVVKLLKN